MAVEVFDTGAAAAAPLSPEAFARKAGWTVVPEDEIQRPFQGDVVLMNGKLAMVLRRQGRGAEVYAVTPTGPRMRAELVAVANTAAAAFATVKLLENTPSGVALEATFKTAEGRPFTLAYELKLGQVFVQTQPRAGATGLQIVAPCRFAVLPDFFADDIVVDAAELPVAEADLPSENFFMHLLGEGEAIVMAVWHPAQDDVRVKLTGEGKQRSLASSEIHFGKDGKVCVAVMNGPNVWHRRDIAPEEGEKILPLAWKAPYPAHWRVDWRRADKLTDSWEMLTQQPGGEYIKHGWYGQPESFGNVDWLKEGRRRWTTVLGSFLYPCWLDKDGQAYLQPLKKNVRFQGPALVYPITRLETTPLDQFTVVDIMRATLGVGPCEYILDVEGQKKTFQGRPTCASRTILDNIYSKRQQKERAAEVRQTLDEVLAFVRHIRGRIQDYVTFGHDLTAYLEEQKKAQPALAASLAELQETVGKIDSVFAHRKDGIKTPEYATQLVSDFRTTLVDYQADDALAKCKRITAALVGIGGNQDELVGECRLVVRTLRQRAALAMASDPRLAPVARQIRQRTQQMLRNPTSYEAPRH